ncbi:mechanosensitive ion channel domain-containing protein [Tamlana sp. 2201CG12-4]|uniref:mechanosensitive ion channel family protein n=1 Tax=Tamlana sp. 2201CG12-4 TaxID=3112582 RepID=UPI002DB56029|nr:mechanosensitive ion channel domain-containing protein [Tamlana sp. 2201CG12-4]MEC3907571.1 mechanosensitive ion channel domain-containing protein [Tamlana sp. 2201CG12-4]
MQSVTDKIEKEVEKVNEAITESTVWEKIVDFLEYKIINFTYGTGEEAHIVVLKVKYALLVALVLIGTTYVLRWVKHLITKHMPKEDKAKFTTVFSFTRWLIYLIVILVVFDSIGINVTAIFAASAALLIGIGLALQTLFQDIISGIFILVDQSVHVGDIIEIDGKVGRVEEIKLRTTRAVTIDNKVLVIPNHLYLENMLFNWTQNGTTTRESVHVGVAYGSDVQLVKKLLIQAASTHPDILNSPEPSVVFTDFGDSALNFKVVFTINDSFAAQFPKSDLRFEIDRLFRENNISIPFPQRDIHIIQKPE